MRRVLWVAALLLAVGLIPAIVRSQEASDPHAGHDMGAMGGRGGHAEEEHWHGDGPAPGTPPPGLDALELKGFHLVSNLHCNACHYVTPSLTHGPGHGHQHGGVPDLALAGGKFRADWLYDFIRSPEVVRPWLAIRMPRFELSKTEAVSLVDHLATDFRSVDAVPESRFVVPADQRQAFRDAGRKLMSRPYFDCWACHRKGDVMPTSRPRDQWAPDLEIAGRRLRPEWIDRFLSDPQALMPGTAMPAYFSDDRSRPEDILGGDESKQIAAIREYIVSLAGPRKPSAYRRQKQRRPDANRSIGAQLTRELNCAGCHEMDGQHQRLEVGPPLALIGSRVTEKWLAGFLRNPERLRPNGYLEGSDSRMPDFRLNDVEVDAITAFLMTRVEKQTQAHDSPRGIAVPSLQRGETLFADLRCAACHQVGSDPEDPSRFSGPNLATAGTRLQEDHLTRWLSGALAPTRSDAKSDAHPLVPHLDLTGEQIHDLAAFVVRELR